MKQPGLDDRQRDKDGESRRKRDDTRNKNLPMPIPHFGPNVTLAEMRKITGKVREADVRQAAVRLRKK